MLLTERAEKTGTAVTSTAASLLSKGVREQIDSRGEPICVAICNKFALLNLP